MADMNNNKFISIIPFTLVIYAKIDILNKFHRIGKTKKILGLNEF